MSLQDQLKCFYLPLLFCDMRLLQAYLALEFVYFIADP